MATTYERNFISQIFLPGDFEKRRRDAVTQFEREAKAQDSGDAVKVYTQATIEVAGHDVPKGTFIDIPETLLPSLTGKVAYLADGGLRTPRNVDDLEALIVGLTADNLALQRLLLRRHCEAFDQNHICGKWNAWERKRRQ